MMLMGTIGGERLKERLGQGTATPLAEEKTQQLPPHAEKHLVPLGDLCSESFGVLHSGRASPARAAARAARLWAPGGLRLRRGLRAAGGLDRVRLRGPRDDAGEAGGFRAPPSGAWAVK